MLGWLGAVAGASVDRRPWAGVATCARRVRVSSRRGVLAEHSVSGGASMMAAAATQHGCAALAEEASRRTCSCDMMGSALLHTRVQRRKRERRREGETAGFKSNFHKIVRKLKTF